MIDKLARAASLDPDRVNIKARTTERLGFEGRQEGISAHAIALVYAIAADEGERA